MDGIDKLSEGQKACLRRVALLETSKEIAAGLGISHHTVDQRLKTAMRVLAQPTRQSAARALVEHERTEHQRLVYQAPDMEVVAELEEERLIHSPPDDWAGDNKLRDPTARNAGTTLEPDPSDGLHKVRTNDLTKTQRALLILALSAILALAFGTLVSGLHGLSEIIQAGA